MKHRPWARMAYTRMHYQKADDLEESIDVEENGLYQKLDYPAAQLQQHEVTAHDCKADRSDIFGQQKCAGQGEGGRRGDLPMH